MSERKYVCNSVSCCDYFSLAVTYKVTANLSALSHIGSSMWCVESNRKHWLSLRFISLRLN